jgi:hypothetical protein
MIPKGHTGASPDGGLDQIHDQLKEGIIIRPIRYSSWVS